MDDLLKRLSAPFPPDRISWRVGSTTKTKDKGMALAYIDARDVQDRLDEACGPGGWECEHYAIGTKTACKIGILIGDRVVWRSDGAGDTDVEGEKGAFSDAFKRAAVKWGVGRYLYDMDSPWVEIEQKGNSYAFTPAAMARLRGQKPPAPTPSPAAAPTSAPAAPTTPKLAPIKAANPKEWSEKFIASVMKAKTIGEVAEIHEANKVWLNQLPDQLGEMCTETYMKRAHFLAQAPTQQAAE